MSLKINASTTNATKVLGYRYHLVNGCRLYCSSPRFTLEKVLYPASRFEAKRVSVAPRKVSLAPRTETVATSCVVWRLTFKGVECTPSPRFGRTIVVSSDEQGVLPATELNDACDYIKHDSFSELAAWLYARREHPSINIWRAKLVASLVQRVAIEGSSDKRQWMMTSLLQGAPLDLRPYPQLFTTLITHRLDDLFEILLQVPGIQLNLQGERHNGFPLLQLLREDHSTLVAQRLKLLRQAGVPIHEVVVGTKQLIYHAIDRDLRLTVKLLLEQFPNWSDRFLGSPEEYSRFREVEAEHRYRVAQQCSLLFKQPKTS